MGPWLHALLLRGSMSILVHFVNNNVQFRILDTYNVLFHDQIGMEAASCHLYAATSDIKTGFQPGFISLLL